MRVHKPRVQAPCSVATHGTQNPKRLVIHCTESNDGPGVTDCAGVYAFWKKQGRGYGAHIVIDKDGNTAEGARGKDLLWHVEFHNTDSLGVELVGFARFTPKVWLARRKQLDKLARWVAYYTQLYRIPIVHSIGHGVCMHRDFKDGTHTDPGAGFPFYRVLRKAKKYRAQGW